MAISNVDKAVEIARATVQASETFMTAMEDLVNLEEKRLKAGVNLTDFDANFGATPGVIHVDGAALNGVLSTSIPAIKAMMVSGNHLDNLQKARP